jgi:hypothetical protein
MSVKMRMPGWIGRREREPVRLHGAVTLRTGRSIAVTLVDTTQEGCRVECEEPLPIGVTVRLDLGDAIADAQIRWAVGGAAGLQFV